MANGVVGDVVAHQFDENGHWLDISANRRAISLDAESLRRIPRVIAVSGGAGKAHAILAGLRGHYCTCLVTDARVAARLVLELHRQSVSERAIARLTVATSGCDRIRKGLSDMPDQPHGANHPAVSEQRRRPGRPGGP